MVLDMFKHAISTQVRVLQSFSRRFSMRLLLKCILERNCFRILRRLLKVLPQVSNTSARFDNVASSVLQGVEGGGQSFLLKLHFGQGLLWGLSLFTPPSLPGPYHFERVLASLGGFLFKVELSRGEWERSKDKRSCSPSTKRVEQGGGNGRGCKSKRGRGIGACQLFHEAKLTRFEASICQV